VVVPGHPSIGSTLENDRNQFDAASVLADMIAIFVIGVVIDSVFSALDKRMRERRGLLIDAS
ncbi:MAG: ABC transporter permease, partial [Frankia sp.]